MNISKLSVVILAIVSCVVVFANSHQSMDHDFESGGTGWQIPSVNWSVLDGVGRNGSRGLVWIGNNTNVYEIASHPVAFAPGQCLRITAWILNDGLVGGKPGFAVEFFNDKGYLTGVGSKVVSYSKAEKGKWVQYEAFTGPMPPAAKTCLIRLFVHKGVSGRCVYDDIEIETMGYERNGMLFSSAPNDCAFDGHVRFSATSYADLRSYTGEVEAFFTFEGEKGAFNAAVETFADGCGEVFVDVKRLRLGSHRVIFTVRTKSGKILDEQQMTFTRLAEPPKGRVRFDEHRRMLIDGKPTYPILVYSHFRSIHDPRFLPAMKASPFRMMMYYTRKPNNADLDYFAENGFMAFVGMDDFYANRPVWRRPSDLNAQDEEVAHTARIVQDVKEHPALLGWYLSDEPTAKVLPRVRERYKLVNALDGNHPCLVVLCHGRLARQAAAGSDVIGLDCYPVPGYGTEKTNPARLNAAVEASQEAVAGLRGDKPFWFVPQAYPHEPERARFPTEHELSSMVWQAVAAGADGVLFYALNEMLSNKDKGGYKFDEAWRTTCTVAQQLKDREDFLLSVEPAPVVTDVPKGAIARAWRFNGRVLLVAVNTTHATVSGELLLDGEKVPISLCADDIHFEER